jgi:hypothetical protein
MLKKFGYTNLIMLVILSAIALFWMDWDKPGVFEIAFLSLFGLTVLAHIVRIHFILKEK